MGKVIRCVGGHLNCQLQDLILSGISRAIALIASASTVIMDMPVLTFIFARPLMR